MADEPCEVMIGRISGPTDPSPIGISVRRGRRTFRVEMTPQAFAQAITGQLVNAVITREDPPTNA